MIFNNAKLQATHSHIQLAEMPTGQCQFRTIKRIVLNTCKPGGFPFPLHSLFGFAGIIILTDAEKVPGHARMHLEESGGAWGETACVSMHKCA